MKSTLTNALGEVYFETEFDPANGWVYGNWKGYVTVEEVINGANLGLQTLIKHKTGKFLNDNSQLEGPWEDANDWIANDWMPRALSAGLSKCAYIISPDIFGQLSAESLNTRVQGLERQLFDNRKEAEKWLQG